MDKVSTKSFDSSPYIKAFHAKLFPPIKPFPVVFLKTVELYYESRIKELNSLIKTEHTDMSFKREAEQEVQRINQLLSSATEILKTFLTGHQEKAREKYASWVSHLEEIS